MRLAETYPAPSSMVRCRGWIDWARRAEQRETVFRSLVDFAEMAWMAWVVQLPTL